MSNDETFIKFLDDASVLHRMLRTRYMANEATKAGVSNFFHNVVGGNDAYVDVSEYARGDLSVDDGDALNQAAQDANALGPRTKLVFPSGPGYYSTKQLVIPGNVDLWMDSPFVFGGSGVSAIKVGESGPNRHSRAEHRIRVQRATTSDWLSELDIGVELLNQYWCFIDLRDVTGFTIGAELRSIAAQGYAYNTHMLGKIGENKIGMDLDATQAGWVNENNFTGGSFTVSSAAPQLDRMGIRVRSSDGTYKGSNSNTWFRPSFEISGLGQPFNGNAIVVVDGGTNEVILARHEGCSPETAIAYNASPTPIFSTSVNTATNIPIPVENGTLAGAIMRPGSTRVADTALRLINRVGPLQKLACPYDASGTPKINVPGLAWFNSVNTVVDARATTGITINTDSITISSALYGGFYISTRTVKRFTLAADYVAGNSGRFGIRAYDNTNTEIVTAGAVRNDKVVLTHTTAYSGMWTFASNMTNPIHITVASNVDHIFVGIGGGQFSSFAVYALDLSGEACSYLTWYEDGINRAIAAPTTGTIEVGREILNAIPAVGKPKAWKNTAGGWVSEGNL